MALASLGRWQCRLAPLATEVVASPSSAAAVSGEGSGGRMPLRSRFPEWRRVRQGDGAGVPPGVAVLPSGSGILTAAGAWMGETPKEQPEEIRRKREAGVESLSVSKLMTFTPTGSCHI